MRDLYLTNISDGSPIIGDASHILEMRRKNDHFNPMVSTNTNVLINSNNEQENIEMNLKNDEEIIWLYK